MIAKSFEIRDAGTFIPVLAVKLEPGCERDRYLLARAGYRRLPEQQAEYIMLCRINGGGGVCSCDPYDWGATRTMPNAHRYIITNWSTLESGAVIDVEFILGEKSTKKKSEQEEESAYGV